MQWLVFFAGSDLPCRRKERYVVRRRVATVAHGSLPCRARTGCGVIECRLQSVRLPFCNRVRPRHIISFFAEQPCRSCEHHADNSGDWCCRWWSQSLGVPPAAGLRCRLRTEIPEAAKPLVIRSNTVSIGTKRGHHSSGRHQPFALEFQFQASRRSCSSCVYRQQGSLRQPHHDY